MYIVGDSYGFQCGTQQVTWFILSYKMLGSHFHSTLRGHAVSFRLCLFKGSPPEIGVLREYVVDGTVIGRLDDLEASATEVCSRGVKLSKITETLNGAIEVMPLLGRFQRLGLVKIVYDPAFDVEPVVQVTEKGKLQITALLLTLQATGK